MANLFFIREANLSTTDIVYTGEAELAVVRLLLHRVSSITEGQTESAAKGQRERVVT